MISNIYFFNFGSTFCLNSMGRAVYIKHGLDLLFFSVIPNDKNDEKYLIIFSDTPTLSSPIHRTEQDFNAATPPSTTEPKAPKAKKEGKKFGRLAALADQINNWEDDLTHHTYVS